MANFFEEYLVTPNVLNKFSNLGLLSNSNNTTQNFGTIGNAADDFIKNKPSQGIISDTITGKDNGKGAVYNAIDNYVKTPDKKFSFDKEQFANVLLSGSNSNSNSSMPQQTQYQFTPIMTDYSQYMGLSPETQRYLYGRW